MIETLVVGSMATNCIILSHGNKCLIVDPGDDAQYIADRCIAGGLTPTAIVLTHGHFDHCLAANELQGMFGIPCYVHEHDEFLLRTMQKSASYYLKRAIIEIPPKINGYLHNKQRISRWEVVHTPGHTPGSITLVGEDALVCGDTVFADGGVGRVDFSYSNADELSLSVKRLLSYPDTYRIVPGHGQYSSVREEKAFHVLR